MLSLENIRTLPESLECVGEFGYELVAFLPFINWLNKSGALGNRKVITYEGMAEFYHKIGVENIVEKKCDRSYLPFPERPWYIPTNNEHELSSSPFAIFPDFRMMFSNTGVYSEICSSAKPSLVLHNKYNVEWSMRPMNFINSELLEYSLDILTRSFQVFYFRPGIKGKQQGFSEDHNSFVDLNERSILNNFPSVIVFEDLFEGFSSKYSYNYLKNVVFANTYHFVTVQGGGSYQCAFYPGSIISILHKIGKEILHNYEAGVFALCSNPAPVRLICLDDMEFKNSISIIEKARASAGAIFLDPDQVDGVDLLSPRRQWKRRHECMLQPWLPIG